LKTANQENRNDGEVSSRGDTENAWRCEVVAENGLKNHSRDREAGPG
jgi:hypothetical protein